MSTTTDTTPGVEATGLTKIYGHGNTEVVAVKDVTLRVARGEIVALLGPSGAGKSTLLTSMALINPPTSGQIHIGGQLVMDGARALVDLRAFRRQHLGFVFQKANLIPFLNARENVQVALEVNDVPPRALANKPSLILADEPTAALDSQRGRQVMELFAQVAHDRGTAVIVVTHDARALDVFDRIVEMEDGRLKNGTKPPQH